MLKMGLVAGLLERTFEARPLELEDLHGHDRRLGHEVLVGRPKSRRRSVDRGVDRGVGGSGSGVLRLLRIVAAGAIAAEDTGHPPFSNGRTVHPPSHGTVRHADGRDAVGRSDDDRGGNWHAIVRTVDPLLLGRNSTRHADRVTVKPSLPCPPAILQRSYSVQTQAPTGKRPDFWPN